MAQETTNPGSSRVTDAAAVGGPGRLLLVGAVASSDDTRRILETAGLSVAATDAPAEALALAVDWQPDLVLLGMDLAAASSADAPPWASRLLAVRRCVVGLLIDEPNADSLARALTHDVDVLIDRAHLLDEVRQAIALRPREPYAEGLPRPAYPTVESLIGAGPAMRAVWHVVARTAMLDSSALLTGETGVGKEVVARILHRLSPRRSRPFVAVNCAALHENLLESELFGHEKGAFTGASNRHIGRFELADGGTLLLDEVGELSASVQAKLLRVLQERTFERVGGNQSVSVDVRIIAATNRDLEADVERGTFRADLLYRLNALVVQIPPLRERRSDILPLWEHFVRGSAQQLGRSPDLDTGLDAKRLLLGHDWPGNIRELQNVARRAVALATGERISVSDLPPSLVGRPTEEARPDARLSGRALRDIERAAILETMEAVGNPRDAAALLGISLRKLYYRLKQYRADAEPGDLGVSVSLAGRGSSRIQERACRVVLAEDDEDIRIALADLLRGEGYEVVDVPSGAEALQHLGAALASDHEQPVDALITDIRMPGLNGLRLLEGMRALGSEVPVIVITAFADRETQEHARRFGALAVLDKPIDVERLVETLHRAAVRREA